MEKIIFELPENTSIGEIISDILKKSSAVAFSFYDSSYDDFSILLEKITVINTVAKDLFAKKITEENAVALLKKNLKVIEPISKKILENIKEKLLPFAKKFTVPEKLVAENVPAVNTEENLLSFMKQMPKINVEKNEKKMQKIRKEVKTEKPVAEKLGKLPQKTVPPERTKPSGPDSYREPVE